MGDVTRNAQGSGAIIGNAGAGTLALILAGFIAFLFAGGMLVDSFAAPTSTEPRAINGPPPDSPAAAKLEEILAQQVDTRRELAELRAALLSRPQPIAGAAVPPSPAARTEAPACRTEPRRDCRPVLQRIDRYLVSINEQIMALPSGPDPRGVPEYGSRLEKIVETIAEARAYLREQGRRLATIEPPQGGGAEVLLLGAATAPAAAVGPPAAEMAWMKLYIVAGMFVILGIVFILAVVAIFTTRNPATLTFATDTVKTMLGFFIGVITAFMSAP